MLMRLIRHDPTKAQVKIKQRMEVFGTYIAGFSDIPEKWLVLYRLLFNLRQHPESLKAQDVNLIGTR